MATKVTGVDFVRSRSGTVGTVDGTFNKETIPRFSKLWYVCWCPCAKLLAEMETIGVDVSVLVESNDLQSCELGFEA